MESERVPNTDFRRAMRWYVRRGRSMLEQLGVLPPPAHIPLVPQFSAAEAARVHAALRLLAPCDVVGTGKIRIGGQLDGGYVLVDQLDPRQPVLSIGIGPSVTFDTEMAERGHVLHLYDHTIETLPGDHPSFTWEKIGVAPETDPARNMRSLADMAARLPQTGCDPILKMDVENAEWAVLAATPPAVLRQFAQITIELHQLLSLHQTAFNTLAVQALRHLTQDFAVVHVHGNNFSPLGTSGGFTVSRTLELTLVRRDLVRTAPNTTWYPTALDTPNWEDCPDYNLWFFPFAPGSENLTLPDSAPLVSQG